MASPSDEALAKSAEAREKGNGLYKTGKLTQAEAAYMEAARLAPNDPRPLSNVAAVKFEMGNHLGAALFSEKALQLLEKQPDDVLQQKLYQRLAKAYLCCGKYAQSRKVAAKITNEKEKKAVEQSLASVEEWEQYAVDEKILWDQVITRLPRYKPTLRNEPEFFSVGHDDAETEFDQELASSAQKDYAFLFCGIGDARNLFATLAGICLMSDLNPSLTAKKFYFTLLDLKPAVFARDLLFFQMLDDCSQKSTAVREKLVTLSFCFAAHVMPSWVYDILQKAIARLLTELDHLDRDVLGRFGIDQPARAAIARHLRNWQKTPKDWYSTANILQLARQQNSERRMRALSMYGEEGASGSLLPGCGSDSPDVRGFWELDVMLPHMDLLEKYEPQLMDLMAIYGRARTSGNKRKLQQYFKEKWKPNMTLIDFDWEQSRDFPDPLMEFAPHEVASSLLTNIPAEVAGPGAHGVLAHLAGFFQFIAISSSIIKHQLVFEIVLDEASSFLEKAGHGLLRRDVRFASGSSSTFPDRYDRIHLSNIPDYIGGPLSTFLYGLPALRNDKSSAMSSTCLSNTRNWVKHDEFLYEYLLLANRKTIETTFGASLSKSSLEQEKAMDGVTVAGGGALMVYPFYWTRMPSRKIPWAELMPRQQMEQWLFTHFLKICIPFPREPSGTTLVWNPLNQTIFFRLLVHLFVKGYPAHWLAGWLNSICSGRITTRARAPRSEMSRKTAPAYPSRTMSVKPFTAEFVTLLPIFRRLLPFGVQLDEAISLPRLDSIHEFTLTFMPSGDLNPLLSALKVLVFLDTKKVSQRTLYDLRSALLDDEDANSTHRDAVHGGGDGPGTAAIHMVTTWEWNQKAGTATFWFAKSFVDRMVAGKWDAFVWSNDTWIPAMGPVSITEQTILCGRSWV